VQLLSLLAVAELLALLRHLEEKVGTAFLEQSHPKAVAGEGIDQLGVTAGLVVVAEAK
jgi:hypothetical protein